MLIDLALADSPSDIRGGTGSTPFTFHLFRGFFLPRIALLEPLLAWHYRSIAKPFFKTHLSASQKQNKSKMLTIAPVYVASMHAHLPLPLPPVRADLRLPNASVWMMRDWFLRLTSFYFHSCSVVAAAFASPGWRWSTWGFALPHTCSLRACNQVSCRCLQGNGVRDDQSPCLTYWLRGAVWADGGGCYLLSVMPPNPLL
ncbi:hypothetical protein V8C37DRAFT_391622 [Trichoderma ceciliae]